MSRELPQSTLDLEILKSYLKIAHGIDVGRITLARSRRQDMRNGKDPRAFCYTLSDSKVIQCAVALEDLPDEARYGVLIHELAHIFLKAFGKKAEIQVDEWVTSEFPEMGYKYRDADYYITLSCGQIVKRKAFAIEHVSRKFIQSLMLEAKAHA